LKFFTKSRSDQLPILLDLGEEKELLRTYTRTFAALAQLPDALDITFSTFSALLNTLALLDIAVA
jgi:hypothetical protein